MAHAPTWSAVNSILETKRPVVVSASVVAARSWVISAFSALSPPAPSSPAPPDRRTAPPPRHSGLLGG